MEEDNWFSAILITIVIKIAWAYYQTMKDISEEESFREYHTATSFSHLNNENNTTPIRNSETPKRFTGNVFIKRDLNIKRKLNVFTSTPVLRTCSSSNDIAENISGISDLDEQMNGMRLNLNSPASSEINRRFKTELTEVESSIIRLALDRGVSPNMELKYKHLFNRSVKGDKKRKNLRL